MHVDTRKCMCGHEAWEHWEEDGDEGTCRECNCSRFTEDPKTKWPLFSELSSRLSELSLRLVALETDFATKRDVVLRELQTITDLIVAQPGETDE